MQKYDWSEVLKVTQELGSSLAERQLDEALLVQTDRVLVNCNTEVALRRIQGSVFAWMVRDIRLNFLSNATVLTDGRSGRAGDFLVATGRRIAEQASHRNEIRDPGKDLQEAVELLSVYLLGLKELDLTPTVGEDWLATGVTQR